MTLASPLKTVIGLNGKIIRKGGCGTIHKVRANGADLFLTAAVTRTGETGANVDLCAAGEDIDGYIIGEWDMTVNLDKDSDDPFADDTWLAMYCPVKGDEIYVTIKTNTAVTINVLVQCEAGFGIPWAYSNATEKTDTLRSIMGKCRTTVAAVGSTETVCLVEVQ